MVGQYFKVGRQEYMQYTGVMYLNPFITITRLHLVWHEVTTKLYVNSKLNYTFWKMQNKTDFLGGKFII